MMKSKRLWFVTGLASILLFITGKLAFKKLFGFFEPRVDGIVLRIRELNGVIKTSTLFSIMLAAIPLVIVLTWVIVPVISLARRISNVVFILIFMITGIVLRHQAVKGYFTNIVRPYFLKKGQLNVDYPIDPVHFVYYMFTGFCIGCIISCFLFRQKIVKKLPGSGD